MATLAAGAAELHVARAMLDAARLHPERPALSQFSNGSWQTLDYAAVAQSVTRLGKGLESIGVRPGDRVGLVGANSPSWSVAYFGILLAGAVIVPLDRLQTPQEWLSTLNRAGVGLVLGSAPEIDALKRADAGSANPTRLVWLADVAPPGELSVRDLEKRGSSADSVFPERSPDDLAVIIFTSGTTGQSKGVMLSHRNISWDARAMLGVADIHASDRFLSVLPLSHAYESTCGLVAPLFTGASVFYARSLTPTEILADLRSSGATYLLAVPLLVEKIVGGIERGLKKQKTRGARVVGALWRAVAALPQPFRGALGRMLFGAVRHKASLDGLRFLICGGAPLAAPLGRAIEALGIGFLQGYGLSETSPVATLNPPRGADPATVGKPLPGVDVTIVDAGADGSGEICIRGPIVMQGYWSDPDATSTVLRDGWLATGDRGRFDRRGHLRITGRSKLLIVTPGGKNISPEEVELALLTSPYIEECMVYGAPGQDGAGEQVEALVYPNPEMVADWKRAEGPEANVSNLLRAEIDRATSQLAHYKHVVRFSVVNEPFVKTTSQKIKRHLYLKPAAGGRS